MSHSTPVTATASSRFGLRAAPAGIELVQELLNTRGNRKYGIPDLLADPGAATAWARQAVEQWARNRSGAAPVIEMTAADLPELRALRARFERMAGHHDAGPSAPVSATVVPGADGTVELVPAGTGWHWLASALWIETFRAQQAGTWPRLKVCRNPDCASAFYDTSRNNSGVWDNVKTCGNAANLRASRERRRARGPELT